MKKAFLLFLCLVMTAALFGCSAPDNGTPSEPTHNEKKLSFWCNGLAYIQEANSIDLTFLSGFASFPIRLDSIDHMYAPYHYFPNGINGTNAGAMAEILTSTATMNKDRETTISVKKQFIDGKWVGFESIYNDISSIAIKNYSTEDRTIQQCYESGWWKCGIAPSFFSIDMDFLTQKGYKADRDVRPYFNEVILRIGNPNYIFINAAAQQAMGVNEGSVYYYLVFDFDEFLLCGFVTEHIMTEYDAYSMTGGFTYYTKEAWEMEMAALETEGYSKYTGQ